MFLLLVATSFELNAQSLSDCPTDGSFPSPPTLTGCNYLSGPTIAFEADGEVLIDSCSFVGFTVTALNLGPTGSVVFSSVDFRDFAITQDPRYAVRVTRATELRLENVGFSGFTGCGAVDGGLNGPSQGKNMWTFSEVSFTDVKQQNYLPVLACAFTYLYGVGLTFTSCFGESIIFLYDQATRIVPVLLGLRTDEVGVTNGVFHGSLAYFVVEGAVMKNTRNHYVDHQAAMYFESTQFIVEAEKDLIGVSSNGGVCAVGCSFLGCSTGIEATQSSAEIFVCRCTFQDCATGIDVKPPKAVVVGCLFSGFTVFGVKFFQGQTTQAGLKVDTQVKDSAFINGTGAAVNFAGSLLISGCCFRANGPVVTGSGILTLGSGCCFLAANKETAVQGPSVTEQEGANVEYGCTRDCSAVWIPENTECTGYNYPPRPTPAPTQTRPATVIPAATRTPVPTALATSILPVASAPIDTQLADIPIDIPADVPTDVPADGPADVSADVSAPDGAAGQVAGGVSGAAIGGGAAGGLAGLAALALLLLLFKKRKPELLPEQPEEDTRTTTVEDEGAFVSEYGLSDGVKQDDGDRDVGDLPQAPGDTAAEDALAEHASEHNPDDLDPDES
jgi:hypothetical protein